MCRFRERLRAAAVHALVAAGGVVAVAACGDETTSDATEVRDVELAFAAVVGDQPFSCTGVYEGIGTTATRVAPLDLRMFVHDVRLLREGGEEVPVELTQDGSWQRDGIALLDFEDDTGTCATGSPLVNTSVRGSAPEHDDYVAIRFKLGLPEEMNHLDAATAPAPLNVTGMWWTWKGGYKFVRLDLERVDLPVEEESAYYFHLGATTCDGTPSSGFSCAYGNRPDIELPMDPDEGVVTLDVAALYADSDLSLQPDFATDFVAGCMAFEGDPECPTVFGKLGMTFESDAAGPAQSVFTVR